MELTIDQALHKAVEAHKAGQVQVADRLYNAILKAQPKHPDANHNMGVLAVGVGQVETALTLFKTALEANPKVAQFWLSYIDALIKLDRIADAKAVMDQAKNKGAKGDGFDKLEQRLQTASYVPLAADMVTDEPRPKQPNILDSIKLDQAIKLAKEKVQDGALEEAKRIYQDILTKFPKNKRAIDGLRRLARGAVGKASKAQDPSQDQIQVLINLYSQGQLQQALKLAETLIKQFPHSAVLLNIQGVVLKGLGQFELSVEAYKKAIAIKPDYAEAYNNIGNALKELGKPAKAIEAYEKALAIIPDYVDAYRNMGIILKEQGKLKEAIEAYKKAIAIKPDYADAYTNLLFCSSSTEYHTPVQHLHLAKGYNNVVSPKFQFRHERIHSVAAPNKLRIGFVSGDLHSHPVAYFLTKLFKFIDKNNFEIVVFSNDNKVSGETRLLRAHTAKWYPITNLPDADVAQLIYENSIDILIDLSGHTAKNRLPVFSYRPARLQMTWLGYHSTTGLNEIDYIIGDKFVLPAESKNHFSEDFALLPNSYLCFSPPDYDIPVAPTPAIENKFITFGCFNNAKKINEKVIKAWSTVLKSKPESKIYLKGKSYLEDRVNYINKCFEANGISVDRILIGGPCSRRTLFESYNRVDIALDPFPYPGGTTTCEAMWMGVPTVTKKGTNFLSNMGQSISVNSGNPDLCVASIEEYIQRCILLAEDVEKLNRDRLERRARISQSSLFDGHLFAKQFGELMKKLANT